MEKSVDTQPSKHCKEKSPENELHTRDCFVQKEDAITDAECGSQNDSKADRKSSSLLQSGSILHVEPKEPNHQSSSSSNGNASLVMHSAGKYFSCSGSNKNYQSTTDLMETHINHAGKNWNTSTIDQYNGIAEANKLTYMCRYCDKRFTDSFQLVEHERLHTGEKRYECRHCNEAFANNSKLTAHMRKHTGEKPYQCETCHRPFARKADVRRHERTHTGEKPYQCETCHRPFAHKSDVQNHMRTHTGEKPYQCETCHWPFARKANVRRHMRTHT